MTEALRLVISGDSKGAVKALDDVKKKAGDTASGFKASTAMIGAAGLAIAGAVAAYAIKSVGTYEDWGKQLKTIQRLTGATAEQAGDLFSQMKLTSGTAVDVGTSLAFYAKNLGAAHAGTGPAAKAFAAMNIPLKDANGEWRTGADILPELRDKLAALPDASTRAAYAAAILGRGYKTLLPYLTASTAAMKDNQKFLKSIGFSVTSKDMAEFSKFAGDEKKMAFAMAYMQFQMGKLVAQLETKVMPTLLKFMGIINHIPPGLILAVGGLAGLVGALNAARTVMSIVNGARGLGGMASKLGTIRGIIPRLTTSLGANALAWGGVGIAATGAAIAIMQAYDAAKKYQDALAQLKTATEGAQATLDANASKLDPAFVAQQQAAINRDSKVNTPWYYYLNPAYAFMEGASKLATGGTVKAQRGGTIIRAAEAGEDEDFVPASKRESYARSVLARSRFARQPDAGSRSVLVTGNTFVGTSRDAERTLTNIVSRRLGPQTARLGRGRMAMANG